MLLTESIVEDALLMLPAATLTRPPPVGEERELGYGVGDGPQLAPGEYAGGTLKPALYHGERELCGEVVQSRVARSLIPAFSHGEKEMRGAVRRSAGAGLAILLSRILATLRDPAVAGLPNLLSGELSVAVLESRMEALA